MSSQSKHQHAVFIVACGALLRMICHVAYAPGWCADSRSYSIPYFLWAHGYFSDGARAPLYPLFLGFSQLLSGNPASVRLASSAAYTAVFLQHVLGLGSAGLLYDTLCTLQVRPRLSFFAALFFALLGPVCIFETLILSESLSLFALLLGASLFARTMRNVENQKKAVKLALITGAAFGCAVLVRSDNLVFFSVVFLATAALWARSMLIPELRNQARLLSTVCLALPLAAAPLILSWMTCNYIGLARFRLTTMTGWLMTQPVYNMFDRVDPGDQVLGEMLVRSFRRSNQGSNIVRDHFWLAFDEIAARHEELPLVYAKDQPRPLLLTWLRGLVSEESRRYTYEFLLGARIRAFSQGDPNDVGDYVGKVAWRLVKKDPMRWISNAAFNFFNDTFNFNYGNGSPEEIRDPQSVDGGSMVRHKALWRFFGWVNKIEAPFLLLAYLATLGYSFCSPLMLRRGNHTMPKTTVMVLALGSLAMMVAYCLFAGFDSRFSVPQLGVFAICAAYLVDRTLTFVEAKLLVASTQPTSTESSNLISNPT